MEIDEQGAKFFFDCSKLPNKQNNEKKEIVFELKEVILEEKKVFFYVNYSEKGNKTKIEDIAKANKIPTEILEKAFTAFKKQANVDYFINKDAEKFLTEQLDMYLHQILLNENNLFSETRLNQYKIIKEFAKKIIGFISQFENELVRV